MYLTVTEAAGMLVMLTLFELGHPVQKYTPHHAKSTNPTNITVYHIALEKIFFIV